jgi:hypothetical protein
MGELIKGGSFLIRQVDPKDVFTPEDFNDFHRMVADTVKRFVRTRWCPSTRPSKPWKRA